MDFGTWSRNRSPWISSVNACVPAPYFNSGEEWDLHKCEVVKKLLHGRWQEVAFKGEFGN